jgi:hypothetical protein
MAKMDKNLVLKVVIVLAAAFGLYWLVSSYYGTRAFAGAEKFATAPVAAAAAPSTAAPLLAAEEHDNDDFKAVDYATQPLPTDCFPRDRLTADDLLPKDAANSKWAQVNPAGQGDVKDQNFLSAGFHVGINTIGSSMRNANYQIRSEPANPQQQVGPWLQSTIEPDLSRRPLEDCSV